MFCKDHSAAVIGTGYGKEREKQGDQVGACLFKSGW